MCAAPILGACTQDQNASNSERDTHMGAMGASHMTDLPPPLPVVVAAAVPAPAPVPPVASGPAPAAASVAPAAAPAPHPAKHP